MNKAEFKEWKANPVTKEVFAEITAQRTHRAERIIRGSAGTDIAEYNKQVGVIQGLDNLLHLDFEEGDVSD